MTKLEIYKGNAYQRHGLGVCDMSGLDNADPSIKAAYESGERMVFSFEGVWGKPAVGYVGITTGWKPRFLYVHNARSLGGEIIPMDGRALRPSNSRRPCKARR